jgi:peroxiredoxin
LEVEIIGVGFDSPENNKVWVDDQGYQYEIWSDTNRTLALHYGAASSIEQSYPSRITRLLDTDGTVLLEYNNANFLSNPNNVLEDCLVLFNSN